MEQAREESDPIRHAGDEVAPRPGDEPGRESPVRGEAVGAHGLTVSLPPR